MNLEKDETLVNLQCNMDDQYNMPPIFLATDTYDRLRKFYNQDEALKLTEIICNNFWKKKEHEREIEKLCL